MELVSAVLTTHNREPEIVKRALMSIAGQTYENLEIIVVDDSTDDFVSLEKVKSVVEEVSKSSGRPVQYIRHEKCQGACAARNTGIDHSHGEFIGFLDDDDEWLPEKTEKMIRKFTSENIGLVYCDDIIVNDTTGEKTDEIRKKMSGRVYTTLIRKNYIGSTSFPLLRKKAVEEAGRFDLKMQSAQDLDLWLRISRMYDITYVDEILGVYHKHDGEQITKNMHKKISGSERINEKNREYLENDPEAYWLRHTKLIPFYVRIGNKKKARAIWKDCVSKCPGKVKRNMWYMLYIILK